MSTFEKLNTYECTSSYLKLITWLHLQVTTDRTQLESNELYSDKITQPSLFSFRIPTTLFCSLDGHEKIKLYVCCRSSLHSRNQRQVEVEVVDLQSSAHSTSTNPSLEKYYRLLTKRVLNHAQHSFDSLIVLTNSLAVGHSRRNTRQFSTTSTSYKQHVASLVHASRIQDVRGYDETTLKSLILDASSDKLKPFNTKSNQFNATHQTRTSDSSKEEKHDTDYAQLDAMYQQLYFSSPILPIALKLLAKHQYVTSMPVTHLLQERCYGNIYQIQYKINSSIPSSHPIDSSPLIASFCMTSHDKVGGEPLYYVHHGPEMASVLQLILEIHSHIVQLSRQQLCIEQATLWVSYENKILTLLNCESFQTANIQIIPAPKSFTSEHLKFPRNVGFSSAEEKDTNNIEAQGNDGQSFWVTSMGMTDFLNETSKHPQQVTEDNHNSRLPQKIGTPRKGAAEDLDRKNNVVKAEEKEINHRGNLTSSRSLQSLSSFSSHSASHVGLSHMARSIPAANILSSWQKRGTVHSIPSGKDLSHQRHLIWLGEEPTVPIAVLRRSLHSRHQHMPSHESSSDTPASKKLDSKHSRRKDRSSNSIELVNDSKHEQSPKTAIEPESTDIRPLSEILKPMDYRDDLVSIFVCPRCQLPCSLHTSTQRTFKELIDEDQKSLNLLTSSSATYSPHQNSHSPKFLAMLTNKITPTELLHYCQNDPCFLKGITNVCNACACSTKRTLTR